MFTGDGMPSLRSAEPIAGQARRRRAITETVNLVSVTVVVCAGLLVHAAWSEISDDPIAVFSAVVQTGTPTRLVLLGLLIGCGVALFALRTRKPVWYGYLLSVLAVAIGWDMLRRQAIQIQAVDGMGLVAALYLFVQGFVEVHQGRERASEAVTRP